MPMYPHSSTDPTDRVGLVDQLVWICPFVGFVAIAVLGWLFGLTVWTAIAVAFLVTCPVLFAWLALGRRFKRQGQ